MKQGQPNPQRRVGLQRRVELQVDMEFGVIAKKEMLPTTWRTRPPSDVGLASHVVDTGALAQGGGGSSKATISNMYVIDRNVFCIRMAHV